ncbi:MBL fold metallo-hydrolase [Lentisphaerota bacterium WC36G]|nr:MBL fold metallo-hydrolase [Lentisphaerae bacterium WC36]
MKKHFRLTVISENSVFKKGLMAEHGVSFFIEYNGKKILFDAGQGFAIAHNTEKLGINLKKLDAVAISHGHYDHVNGLGEVSDLLASTPIHAHPKIFQKRYSLHTDGTLHNIGIDPNLKNKFNFKYNESATEIVPGCFLTGNIPFQNHFEICNENFYIDKQCKQQDLMPDDQALYFKTAKGLIIVLGCSHTGVINAINYVKKLSNCTKVLAVIGGMHLKKASEFQQKNTLESLKELNIKYLYANHCTGENFINLLIDTFSSARCQRLSTGDQISLI